MARNVTINGDDGCFFCPDERQKSLSKKQAARRRRAVYHIGDVIESDVDGRLLLLTNVAPPTNTDSVGCHLEAIACDKNYRPIGTSIDTLVGLQVARKIGHIHPGEETSTWMDVRNFLLEGKVTLGLSDKLPSGPLRETVRLREAQERQDSEEAMWGVSEQDEFDFICPNCRSQIHFAVWTRINAQKNPELAAAILDNSYCEFTCKICGHANHYRHPCLYLDPDRNAFVYHVTNEQLLIQAEKLFHGLANKPEHARTTMRIVLSEKVLQEKVAILEAGLDDRVIELLKLGIVNHVFDGEHISSSCDYIARFVSADENALTFELEICTNPLLEPRRLTTSVSIDAYELCELELACSTLANDQPLYVDSSWAYHASTILN